MAEPVHLHGYRYSVFSRAVLLVLLWKKVEHRRVEVDPFAELSEGYLAQHPFGKVPLLTHGAFQLFETEAITRYIDRAFEGPSLQPRDLAALARMDQLLSAIHAYAYWPMVRQVASHAFFRPLFGEKGSQEEIRIGLAASSKILAFLDRVAGEGAVLGGRDITLADLHLAPMMDYFVRSEEGRTALIPYLALRRWWDQVSALDIVKDTDPFLEPAAPI